MSAPDPRIRGVLAAVLDIIEGEDAYDIPACREMADAIRSEIWARFPEYAPHASDCPAWVAEPCRCDIGRAS